MALNKVLNKVSTKSGNIVNQNTQLEGDKVESVMLKQQVANTCAQYYKTPGKESNDFEWC